MGRIMMTVVVVMAVTAFGMDESFEADETQIPMEILLKIKDPSVFMELATQHTDAIDTSLIEAFLTPEPNGPEPNANEKAENDAKQDTKAFREEQRGGDEVKHDEQTAEESDNKTFKEKQTRDLKQAQANCKELQLETDQLCAKDMCASQETCGNKDGIQHCKEMQRENQDQAEHDENVESFNKVRGLITPKKTAEVTRLLQRDFDSVKVITDMQEKKEEEEAESLAAKNRANSKECKDSFTESLDKCNKVVNKTRTACVALFKNADKLFLEAISEASVKALGAEIKEANVSGKKDEVTKLKLKLKATVHQVIAKLGGSGSRVAPVASRILAPLQRAAVVHRMLAPLIAKRQESADTITGESSKSKRAPVVSADVKKVLVSEHVANGVPQSPSVIKDEAQQVEDEKKSEQRLTKSLEKSKDGSYVESTAAAKDAVETTQKDFGNAQQTAADAISKTGPTMYAQMDALYQTSLTQIPEDSLYQQEEELFEEVGF